MSFDTRRHLRPIAQYSAAVLLTLGAFALTLIIPPIKNSVPFALFFAAVAITARLGGWGPVFLAIALSIGLGESMILPTSGTYGEGVREVASALAFLAVSGIIVKTVKSKSVAEQRAHDALAQLSTTLDNSPDAIIQTNLDGTVMSWNRGAERLYGYSAADIVGKPMSVIVPPEREEIVRAEDERLRRGESVEPHEAIRLARDGRRLNVAVSAAPVRNASGAIVAALRIGRDVTAEKRAREDALLAHRRSDRALALVRGFMESAPLGFSLHDADSRFLDINTRLAELNGLTREGCIGKTIDVAFPGIGPQLKPLMQEVAQTGVAKSFEVRGDTRDATTERYWSIHYFPVKTALGELIGVGSSVADITEEKRTQEKLLVQAQLLELANEPIFVRDEQDRIIYWNAGAESLYGYTREEAVGVVSHDLLNTIFPDTLDDIRATLAFRHQWRGELEHTTKTGDKVIVSSSWSRFESPAGPLTLETNFDLTALKQAQQKSEEMFERLEVAQQFGNMGAWEWDIENGRLWWSEGIYDLHAMPRGTPPTLNLWTNSIISEDRPRINSAIESALAGRTQYEVDYRTPFPNGEIHWITSRARVMLDEGGKPLKMVGICFDVTAQRRQQEIMRKTEKLAAAGRLAATVAHEINNPLEAVTNILYLLKGEAGFSDRNRELLLIAEQELDRVAHIARQTLGFYREVSTPVMIDLAAALEHLLSIYEKRLTGKSLSVTTTLAPGARIFGNPGEINQVVSNLIANAMDATPSGGRLRIRLRTVGSRVKLTIADNGHGIPPEIRQHIFEPFFTTKKDVGTGLGLWVTMGILDKHGARLQLRSRAEGLRTGTVFVITFHQTSAPAKASA